ncbi:MAG: DUF6364 family protein [Spirochaetota bacterium]
MSNITLSMDDDIIKKVRKIAIDKNTTLTAMVRDYLVTLASTYSEAEKNQWAGELETGFKRFSRNMGKRTWKREDLYD